MVQEITKDQLGTRQTARANAQLGEQLINIELSKIVVRENFNVRVDYGDIEGLAQSILENGQTLPGRVDVMADGSFTLTDGHRRFKAFQLLAEQGHEGLFKAILNGSKTTEEQRILQMFTTQDNKGLEPHEVAELINRLVNLGHTQSSVAKKIGKTPAYISQMLSFANEAPSIKEEVKKGNLSVSSVLKLQKDIPQQTDRIEAVKQAASTTDGKISIAAVKGKTAKEEKLDKFTEIAHSIIQHFDIEEEEADNTIINLLKKYL